MPMRDLTHTSPLVYATGVHNVQDCIKQKIRNTILTIIMKIVKKIMNIIYVVEYCSHVH